MHRRRGMARFPALLAAGLSGGLSGTARAQFGIVASGVGPINRSTGGAAVEAPIDAAGGLIGTWPQYPWTDAFSTRVGYTFGLDLVGPSLPVYILGAPDIIQHTADLVYPGATVSL